MTECKLHLEGGEDRGAVKLMGGTRVTRGLEVAISRRKIRDGVSEQAH